jgi:hypothetical protein
MVINVSSLDDYKVIEYLFDDDDDDMDTLGITYPITIILDNHSEVLINSDAQLNSYSLNCNGENEYDFDIECLDFNYPITTFLYNSNNEIIDSFNINSDSGLYNFIDDLNASDIVSIKFPITVTLFDNTEISITNLLELQNIIKLYENDCDEDDDYDYNDDDCDDCTIDELTSYLTTCPGWTVDKLERYGNDYDNAYDGYVFNFLNDGTISVYYSGGTDYGTWTASGTGNNITVTINVPDLPYCNNNWILHEISKYNESKIDFRVGNDDRMRYENTCN